MTHPLDTGTLRDLARANGVEIRRPSAEGPTERVSDRNLRRMLEALGVKVPEFSDQTAKCFIPDSVRASPVWGINLQLYELRSSRNWGIGDFADLWAFCELAAGLGADFVGLNPLHAGFLSDPDRCSPYEPSNRNFLNPLYIAVDEVGGYIPDSEINTVVSRLRDTALVEYGRVAEIKLKILRDIWNRQRDRGNLAFESFVHTSGEPLHRHAVFEALSQDMIEAGHGAGWKSWPLPYRSPSSGEVRAFEKSHVDEIQFQKWLQWCAHVQLSEAKERARTAGMAVGLYLDLAVGEALDGSATWSDPDFYVKGAAIGNPPEPLATNGQDWRLAALLPTKIAHGEDPPFRKMLVSAMRYAGAIRIDHAAAFARLFLVPVDGIPADGTYVAYPTRSMLRVLAETSAEYRCIVIGEDLGNIADGLQDDLLDADVLSYRILSFEQNTAGFAPVESYPATALACISTHDHQTFEGWWQERDIDLRLEHGLVSSTTTENHRKLRKLERENLLTALREERLIAYGARASHSEEKLVVAAYRFIARTPSLLVSVRLADMTHEKAATNIPGTKKSYPNWKPKLRVPLESLAVSPLVTILSEEMNRERPSARRQDDRVGARKLENEDGDA